VNQVRTAGPHIANRQPHIADRHLRTRSDRIRHAGLEVYFDSARPGRVAVIAAPIDHLGRFDDQVRQQLRRDAQHAGGGCIGIEQENARGGDRPDVRAKLANLLPNGLANRVKSGRAGGISG